MNVTFKQFPAVIQELEQTNSSLQQALERLEDGSPSTPRSWFYEAKSPDWILGSLEHELNAMRDLRSISDWDLSKSDKFAPQGGSAPLKDRLDTLDEYFQHLMAPIIIKDSFWKKAKLEATRRLRFNESGSPLSAEQVVARGTMEDKYNTSSGFPLWIKRRSPEAKRQAIEAEGLAISLRYPFVLGTRASMGKTGISARNIFMAPMALNVHGQKFLYPLQDYIRSLGLDFYKPWEGWEETQSLISSTWTPQVLKFGTDYSKMDQHFNKFHGREVFDVVKYFFSRKYWDELLESIEYVFQAPIITNLGYIDQEHAMPSGSEWTNFLETVWDYILGIFLELKYGIRFKMRSGIGDDQLYLIEGISSTRGTKWILDTVVGVFEDAGTPGNSDKQEVSFEETTFLQRLLSNDWNGINGGQRALGVYSLIRNATSQVYPEFYHNDKLWNWEMFALRALQIGENCYGHPKFGWYAKFVADSNDNIRRFVNQSTSKIKAAERRARLIANFMPTYTQAKQRKPIFEYEIFKLIKNA